MHHPKTRPVFEPHFICHRNNTTVYLNLFPPKHKVWSCLIKPGHNICFGVNKSTCRAVAMTSKKWFKTGRVLGWCIYWFTGLSHSQANSLHLKTPFSLITVIYQGREI